MATTPRRRRCPWTSRRARRCSRRHRPGRTGCRGAKRQGVRLRHRHRPVDERLALRRELLELLEVQLAEQFALGGEPLRVDAQRAGEFGLRGGRLVEPEQPRAAFRDANRGGHRWRAPRLDLRPQAGGHLVEALQFQIAKLLRLFDGRLTERGEFGLDVRVRRVNVDGELPGDLAIRAAGLPQLERNHAPLGDGLDLAASSATGSVLRVCGVAPWSTAVGSAWNRDIGNPSSWHSDPSWGCEQPRTRDHRERDECARRGRATQIGCGYAQSAGTQSTRRVRHGDQVVVGGVAARSVIAAKTGPGCGRPEGPSRSLPVKAGFPSRPEARVCITASKGSDKGSPRGAGTDIARIIQRFATTSRSTPFSASTTGSRRSTSSSPSCRAAAPSPRPRTAG